MSIICSDNKRTGCGQNLSDLVKLLGEVVHPVSNNSLPDELALSFKPSILIISLISSGILVGSSYQFGFFLFDALAF